MKRSKKIKFSHHKLLQVQIKMLEQEYYDRLNELIASTFNMINVFKNSSSKIDTFSDPVETARISTFGVFDMESGEEITTDPWHVKNEYKNLIKNLQNYYKRNCRLNLIDYVALYTDDNLDKGLNEYFKKRQKLG